AAIIVVLLDGRSDDARHADAVAAHVERGLTPALIKHQRLHRLRVLAAELEDVADLDAARDLEAPTPRGARIALDDLAQVGRGGGWNVAVPVDTDEVLIFLVGAADEVGERERRMIGVDRAVEADEAHVAGLGTGRRAHPLG